MGSQHSYQIAHTVIIHHEYFTGNTCQVALVPTPETIRTMRNHGLLIRQQDACTWVMLAAAEADDNMPLHFEIRHQTPAFYFYSLFDSDTAIEGPCSLSYVGGRGVWASMTIRADALSRGDRTSLIPIRCKEKYWEIILFSKYGKLSDSLAAEDEEGRLFFSAGTPVEVPGAGPALRFVSTVPVALRDRYPYRLRLMERLRQGVVMRCRIAVPQPSVVSPFDPHGAITVYCYC